MVKKFAFLNLIKKLSPQSTFIGGGGWSSYNPTEILELVPELDMICIGEGELTFSELYDEMSKRGYEKKFVLPVSRWNDFYNTYIFKTFTSSKRFKRKIDPKDYFEKLGLEHDKLSN